MTEDKEITVTMTTKEYERNILNQQYMSRIAQLCKKVVSDCIDRNTSFCYLPISDVCMITGWSFFDEFEAYQNKKKKGELAND